MARYHQDGDGINYVYRMKSGQWGITWFEDDNEGSASGMIGNSDKGDFYSRDAVATPDVLTTWIDQESGLPCNGMSVSKPPASCGCSCSVM